MTIDGEYEPSPSEWVRNQVAEYEASGGQRANTLLDTGMPVIILSTRGNKTGKVRKTPLIEGRAQRRVRPGRLSGWGTYPPGLVPQPRGRSDRGGGAGRA